MAYGQRQIAVVFLMIFSLVISSTAVPISRSLKTIKSQVSVGPDFRSQDVKEEGKDHGQLSEMEKFVEGRMNMELEDYPGTGANHHHDPKPPLRN